MKITHEIAKYHIYQYDQVSMKPGTNQIRRRKLRHRYAMHSVLAERTGG